MNLVNLEAVGKAYGTRVILDGVSLGVAAGERIGVVGRNGGGKSTLVRLLAAEVAPDCGRVTHTGGLRIGLLHQQDDLAATARVGSAVLGDRAEHEWAGDPRTREILTGLFGGLDLPLLPGGLAGRVALLSGGERRRVALARLLVDDPDLLVLDEPTNHLDVEAVDWLARHLAEGRQALVVVTHDRWFLDTVCLRTWEVADGTVHEYEGGYSAYVLARAERARVAAAEESRRTNLLRKELAWLRRGPPARTAKPRFRVEAANALVADEPPPRDDVALARFAATRLGRTVYELDDVSLRIGSRVLLDRVTWQLGPGDRVGLVGVNGTGKTSLLRLLAGEVGPTTGRVRVGRTVRVAYLSQQVEELADPTQRVLGAVEEVRRVVDLGRGRTATASQLLERFGFTGNAQWTPVGELSGGERRRLQLLRLLMDEPNVLLLDEPTNDLDIETLTALEDLLDGWAGSLLVVSHDRYFVERVCGRVLALLGDGRLRDLAGGVEEYLERRRALVAQGAGRSADGRPAEGRSADGRPAEGRSADPRAARKELARLERALDKLAAREERLHEELAAAATDFARLSELDTQLRALLAEREQLEDRWLQVAERG